MKKFLLLPFLLFLIVASAYAQERVEITGTLIVPVGYNSGGVHVYNKSSGRGSISDAKGNFELRVIQGDSVYFSALQFKELLVIVDAEVVEKRRLVVEIFEGMNELPEVVVRPHDLTGSSAVDAENIKTEDLDLPAMTAFSINDYDWEFRQDGQTAVTNSAMGGSGGRLTNGVNPLAILSAVAQLLIPKKPKKEVQKQRSAIGLIHLERRIRARYSDDFFLEQLKIPPSKIADFISFLEAQNITGKLLEKDREMDLLQMMFVQSEKFLKL